MNTFAAVQLLDHSSQQPVEACIVPAQPHTLPSLQEGWIFDHRKHSQAAEAQPYVLTTQANPQKIEGCLIFELKNGILPWMAYVEAAPHNCRSPKQYQRVGASLIAWACWLSIQQGQGHHKGFLTFEVAPRPAAAHLALFNLYRKKYGALAMHSTEQSTVFLIPDQKSHELVERYLSIKKEDLP